MSWACLSHGENTLSQRLHRIAISYTPTGARFGGTPRLLVRSSVTPDSSRSARKNPSGTTCALTRRCSVSQRRQSIRFAGVANGHAERRAKRPLERGVRQILPFIRRGARERKYALNEWPFRIRVPLSVKPVLFRQA